MPEAVSAPLAEVAGGGAGQRFAAVFYASHAWHPFFLHGTKTYVFEIWEQLGGRLPDALVVPAGNGTLVPGCYLGCRDLLAQHLIDRLSAITAVQAEGCAPLAEAFARGLPGPAPVTGAATIAEGIAIARPPRAVLFTVSNAPYFNHPIQFSYQTEQFHPAGTASPASLTLAPGRSDTFQVSATAGQAGDETLKLHLGTGSSTDGSIPIILRALVPLTSAGGSFSGTLTGGGATGNAGQEFTYQFKVPAGEPSLNVGVTLADNNYNLLGFLVDPHGEPLDAQSNAQFDASDFFQGYGPTMQFFRGTPAAGVWTLVLLDAGPGDGAHLSEPFTGSVSFAAPSVTSSGIPNSSKTVLPAGQPATATITITNTGNIRKDFFADPRLSSRTPQELLGSDVNDVSLPLSLFAQPNWLVPPGTTELDVAAQGTVPITMDVSWAFGDPIASAEVTRASGSCRTGH